MTHSFSLNRHVIPAVILIALSILINNNILATSCSQPAQITNCSHNFNQEDMPSVCKYFSGSIPVNIPTTSSTNQISFDWNNEILKKAIINSSPQNGSVIWNTIKDKIVTQNGIKIYDPTLASISTVNYTLTPNLYGTNNIACNDLNGDQASYCTDVLFGPPKKNLFLHTFNSKGGLYIANTSLPFISSSVKILNHNYKDTSGTISSIFTAVSGNNGFSNFFIDSSGDKFKAGDVYSFSNCVDKNNNNCYVTLSSSSEISFEIEYSKPKLTQYYPVYPTGNTPPTGYTPSQNMPLLAVCLNQYLKEAGEVRFSSANITDFFSSSSSNKYSISKCLKSLNVPFTFSYTDSMIASCEKALTTSSNSCYKRVSSAGIISSYKLYQQLAPGTYPCTNPGKPKDGPFPAKPAGPCHGFSICPIN